MITITVTCNQAQDREFMTTILTKQNDFSIASIGKDGYDALTSAKTHQPDIIIMDFNLGGINSTEIAPIIKRNSPSTNLIALYSSDEQEDVGLALSVGISGCLLKQRDIDNLVSSVRCVYHGGLYLSQSIKNNVLQWLKKSKSITAMQKATYLPNKNIAENFFSFTELRIFFGILLGHTDKEIAKHLNMCEGAVRNCITRVKNRTGFQNRTQMAIFALFTVLMDRKSIRGQLADFS